MPLDDRKLEVLRAIVHDYVATQEPVGSRVLAERHRLGVSPATIRNDMAALEEDGYLTHPHTSAGRVPTDKGYRLFVDRLSSVKPLSPAERRAIESFLEGAVDLDDIVSRTVRLLAQLTRQVAVVQYPSLTRSAVRHVELVPLTPTRLLVVLITTTGRVEQRALETSASLTEEEIGHLRALLNASISGQWLAEAPARLESLLTTVSPDLAPTMVLISSVLLETLAEKREERVLLAGAANLTRNEVDFRGSIRPVLEALEEQVVLLRLIGEVESPSTLRVRIGDENEWEGLRGTSVVTAGYGSGDTALAGLGVLGPTRMDYAGTIGAVQAVARYVGDLLASS
jgi:heat-inducible transcriptional repressor